MKIRQGWDAIVTGVPVGAGLTAITTLAGRQRLSLRG
jgi:hypothetical protein